MAGLHAFGVNNYQNVHAVCPFWLLGRMCTNHMVRLGMLMSPTSYPPHAVSHFDLCASIRLPLCCEDIVLACVLLSPYANDSRSSGCSVVA